MNVAIANCAKPSEALLSGNAVRINIMISGEMSDRELLELAAKAAGKSGLYRGDTVSPSGFYCYPDDTFWNPLTDDGDALRLAVKRRMCVEPWGAGAAAVVIINDRACVAEPHYGDDPARATRRAIVRAAAEIGRNMP